MRRLINIVFIICLSLTINAQEHYQVEFESFSPPEKDLIASLKGFPAEAFLAKDSDGKEHFLNDYRGKTVLLYFYSVVDKVSFDWMPLLNLLQIQYIDDLQVFGFAEEERTIIDSATKNGAIVFPNFPNGTKFGEMAYAGDLGLGRIILINKEGIISEVLPRSWILRYSKAVASEHLDQILTAMIYGK